MGDGNTDAAENKTLAVRGAKPALNGGELLTGPGAGAKPNTDVQLMPTGGQMNLEDAKLYASTAFGDRARAVGDQKPDRKLHVENHGTSPELANTVQNAIDNLPSKVKQQLQDQGVQVYAFNNIQEYDKFFGTHKVTEVVDGQKLAAEDAASLNDVTAHPPRIAIFEKTMSGEPIANFEDIGGLTRHELGHIITNKIMPNIVGGQIVGDFDRNLAQDVMEEGARVPASLRNGVLSHYFRGGVAEIYAESFAMSVGGGSSRTEDAQIQKYFPRTLAYMRNEFAT